MKAEQYQGDQAVGARTVPDFSWGTTLPIMGSFDLLDPLTSMIEGRLPPSTEPLKTSYERLFSLAQPDGDIVILTNFLTPQGIADPDLVGILHSKLRQGTGINLMFHEPSVHSHEEAEQHIDAVAPTLRRELDRPDGNLRIWWLKRQSRVEFAIVNQRHTLNESPDHEIGEKPEVLFTYNNEKRARHWYDKFMELSVRPDSPVEELVAKSPEATLVI